MLNYFYDKSLSVIDICNIIALSDFEFVIKNLKKSKPKHPIRRYFKSEKIYFLNNYLYIENNDNIDCMHSIFKNHYQGYELD